MYLTHSLLPFWLFSFFFFNSSFFNFFFPAATNAFITHCETRWISQNKMLKLSSAHFWLGWIQSEMVMVHFWINISTVYISKSLNSLLGLVSRLTWLLKEKKKKAFWIWFFAYSLFQNMAGGCFLTLHVLCTSFSNCDASEVSDGRGSTMYTNELKLSQKTCTGSNRRNIN